MPSETFFSASFSSLGISACRADLLRRTSAFKVATTALFFSDCASWDFCKAQNSTTSAEDLHLIHNNNMYIRWGGTVLIASNKVERLLVAIIHRAQECCTFTSKNHALPKNASLQQLSQQTWTTQCRWQLHKRTRKVLSIVLLEETTNKMTLYKTAVSHKTSQNSKNASREQPKCKP